MHLFGHPRTVLKSSHPEFFKTALGDPFVAINVATVNAQFFMTTTVFCKIQNVHLRLMMVLEMKN